ncbi:hypothetical protein BIY29_18885 [Brenneria alni]|uniref:Uncharacterized protein n=1 Tax=Brenneria alni TaxID=71656 RepID=A0A421DIY0_9GAMM|nr:hypothetical protein [Brenneria alni]RLM17823.1 hypothetical protein BIY29_18885 [Brenneria alni]
MKKLCDKKVASSVVGMMLDGRFFRWLKAFFSDPWRKTLVIIPFIIIVVNIIPSFYAWIAEIPKEEEIHYTQGELVLRKNNKKGIQLGLKKNNKIEYFSCADQLNVGHFCGPSDDLLHDWSGKQAEVGWFYQSAYFFYSQRRLVRLKVEGEEKISLEDVSKDISYGRKSAVRYVVMYNIPIIFLVLYLIRRFIYKKNEV